MHTDLCAKINAMYALLDSDANGSLSFDEFRDGCRKLTHNAETPIEMRKKMPSSLTDSPSVHEPCWSHVM